MLVRNETFAVAPILPTNVRVIVNQLRKINAAVEDRLAAAVEDRLAARV